MMSSTGGQYVLSNTSVPMGDISPVTLGPEGSKVARLLLVVGLATVGSVGNVYMISAVIVEDHLKKTGNTFLVNIALADLLVTGIVMPASAVVILAGLPDSPPVCHVQWFLAILCWIVTVLTLLAVSVENYARLCSRPERYALLTPSSVTLVVLCIWILGTGATVAQSVYDLGPDYCGRKKEDEEEGMQRNHAAVATTVVAIIALFTSAFYLAATYQVRSAHLNPSFKPPLAFTWDYSLMKTNISSFILFFAFWLPFGIVLAIDSSHQVSSKLFYILAWFALSKSCVNNILYAACNRHFRSAYLNLFHYCCCKTTVAFSRRPRGEVRPSGDVRVHIIPGYNMYSYTSPQRASRESKSSGKRGSNSSRSQRANGREVYQL
ncbi:alpha-1A adrenergic receptor-like [Macrosteles quadrilineatus]|uniref:alpha-1A adrenergic receptor-like n=1 Tax=Macrosteles quadrilineatus TaxID=74068 RepID=UPI0023E13F0C|nr:alpha-1A adrenergic receptor-like [Macrosteles quadrilineatus]